MTATGKPPITSADEARQRMVSEQLARRGIHDARVLAAMGIVRRECFVPAALRQIAYADRALPIERGQTISQPFIVALMLQLAEIAPADRVLDIGTGSGYAAAVASRLAAQVVGIERLPTLARRARARLAALGFGNVEVLAGDGSLGWPEKAPFDAILVAAAAPAVPAALQAQLAPGGRLVIPVGAADAMFQRLLVIHRVDDGFTQRDVDSVSFVPLVGAQGWPDIGLP